MQGVRHSLFLAIVTALLLIQTGCAALWLKMNCVPDPQKEAPLPQGWDECFEKDKRKQPFSHEGITHSVFCRNDKSGKPPVLLLHELPGLSPGALSYAEELSEDFTVYVPLLFGKKGETSFLNWEGLGAYWFTSEWDISAESGAPIVNWLRDVVRAVEKQHLGQRIGIIGNCMTGSFPLALLNNPQVGAVVVAQPALPMSFFWWPTESDKQSLGLSKLDHDAMQNSTAKIYGVRFQNDCIADQKKHQWLKDKFPTRFRDGEIKEEDYKESDEPTKAHSTLIGSWKAPGKLGKASRKAREQVHNFLCQELSSPCPAE